MSLLMMMVYDCMCVFRIVLMFRHASMIPVVSVHCGLFMSVFVTGTAYVFLL